MSTIPQIPKVCQSPQRTQRDVLAGRGLQLFPRRAQGGARAPAPPNGLRLEQLPGAKRAPAGDGLGGSGTELSVSKRFRGRSRLFGRSFGSQHVISCCSPCQTRRPGWTLAFNLDQWSDSAGRFGALFAPRPRWSCLWLVSCRWPVDSWRTQHNSTCSVSHEGSSALLAQERPTSQVPHIDVLCWIPWPVIGHHGPHGPPHP